MPEYDNLIGTRLENRYEIEGYVDGGATAHVYSARDIRSRNKRVAVKILKKHLLSNHSYTVKMINESEVIKSLNHINIISVYSVNYVKIGEDSYPYIVMEFAGGESLREHLDNAKGPLSFEETLDISLQIASALKCVHENGFVHRDVKPTNLIFTEDKILKLTDFGIALLGDDKSRASESVSGTPLYMSPEQIFYSDVDGRADIYSLGVTMYEMICGKPPFYSRNETMVYGQQTFVSPNAPCEENPLCPLGLSEIIDKCLRKNRDERFPDCETLIEYLLLVKENPSIVFDFSYQDSLINENDALPKETELCNFTPYEMAQPKSTKEEAPTVKESKKEKTGTTPLANAAIVVFISVFIALSVFLLHIFITDLPSEELWTGVENYVGRRYTEELRQSLESSGYKVIVVNGYDSLYPEGTIIDQSPEVSKYYRVDDSSLLTLVINSSADPVTIDDYRGRYLEDAVKSLEEKGLVVSVIERDDSSVDIGCVISTYPEAQSALMAGEEIIVYTRPVEKTEYAYVPNCVGFSISEAGIFLADSGLSLGDITFAFSNTVKEGKIISQSRIYGERVPSDYTVIDLVVSLGEKK